MQIYNKVIRNDSTCHVLLPYCLILIATEIVQAAFCFYGYLLGEMRILFVSVAK